MTNPFMEHWDTPFEAPPFDRIEVAHFEPAFDAAICEYEAEIAAIRDNPDAPTFENSIEARERAGRALSKVSSVFYNLSSSHTNDEIMEIERSLSPRMAKLMAGIGMDPELFARIDAVMQAGADLTPEQARVLERYHTAGKRSGAQLDDAARAELKEIAGKASELCTQFAQNVLKAESEYELPLTAEQAAELPAFVQDAARQSAKDRDSEADYVITLSRSSVEPFLTFAPQRDLRERAFQAWVTRAGSDGETDNRGLIAEILKLRLRRAQLLGHDSYSEFQVSDNMAKTPDAVQDLLSEVWRPARVRALEERDALQAEAQSQGDNAPLAAWDWRYYADAVRRRVHDLNEEEIKPYFQLDQMIEAAFHTAHRLFGLSFKERDDFATYHEDVRVWEVFDSAQESVGLFFGDYFARPSKRGGAWMSAFRSQQKLYGDHRPIIINNMNFNKGSVDHPTLLSFTDALTLFHEFGHGLHGLCSNVTYPRISGTSVARDFVELPSQLFEHWLTEPDILRRFARHHETGEQLPEDVLQRLIDAQTFNQGFATVEYLSCALLDLEMHRLTSYDGFDIDAFEKDALGRIGMPDEIVMRHRPGHFLHLFSGDGYASGYYSYMWSEVMDADAFEAFEETGNAFDAATAKRLLTHVYSAGGTQEPAKAYTDFRGRLPTPAALLRNRGLAG